MSKSEPEMITVRTDRLSTLLTKSRELAELMQQAETNHGGLIGPAHLKSANELRLELSRWK